MSAEKEKQFCMLLKINIDCNSCCKKLRRIILSMKAIESHLIEKERYRVRICGRFAPADIAIKIRKKMNRRVEILDVKEIEMEADAPDQNPPPPSFSNLNPNSNPNPNPNPNPNQISMFPSLDNHNRSPIFPSLSNECRSFSSFRPDFTVTYFPDSFGIGDMPESFWHY